MFDPIDVKMQRLAVGKTPRAVDLFAGCGGISLGFQKAGFSISAAVEMDPHAALSHAMNFYRNCEPEIIAKHSVARDITVTEPEQIISEYALGDTETAVDVIVGGPPCQAYARVGRAKLREVAEHPQAFKVDPRGNLYLRYLHYVDRLKPLALLMENVPDIMNYGGHNIVEEIREALEAKGYVARYSLLNSAHYGVPQMRDRVFLIAYHKKLVDRVTFPAATNWWRLPTGYDGTRSVALKHVDIFNNGYIGPDLGDESLPKAVTAEEAIGDLPPITLHLEGKLKRGARRFTELAAYRSDHDLSPYAQLMRNWPGFLPAEGVYDHVIRYLPRDGRIFRAMKGGDEYPRAHALAMALFEQDVKERERQLKRSLTQTERQELQAKVVPPYPVGSFPNRWWKLNADGPVRTLMAHIGKDTYSHIHYDSAQARVISVREAARLQSFPDGFILSGTMNPAFRQIGNAVPPLMAFQLAKHIRTTMQQALDARMELIPSAAVA